MEAVLIRGITRGLGLNSNGSGLLVELGSPEGICDHVIEALHSLAGIARLLEVC